MFHVSTLLPYFEADEQKVIPSFIDILLILYDYQLVIMFEVESSLTES